MLHYRAAFFHRWHSKRQQPYLQKDQLGGARREPRSGEVDPEPPVAGSHILQARVGREFPAGAGILPPEDSLRTDRSAAAVDSHTRLLGTRCSLR